MDWLPLILLLLGLGAIAGLAYWRGYGEWAAAFIAVPLFALVAWALAPRRDDSSAPTAPPPTDHGRSAGRRLEEARADRAPTTNADADTRAAADRLNRRRP